MNYRATEAVAAGLWFRGWSASIAESQATARLSEPAEYQPGRFFLRELPGILRVLEPGPKTDVVVIDGYVTLGGEPGLGSYLHASIGGMVVGVAKSRFRGATDAVEVYRGRSRRPLYVTSLGCEAKQAAEWIAAMHGPHRIPTMLKKVDALSRTRE